MNDRVGKTGPLAILSVHASGSAQRPWLALQSSWVARTTETFRFGIVENGVRFEALPDGLESIVRTDSDLGHARGLELGLEWFRSLEASHLLILDSDAFPIKPGWFGELVGQMARFGKRLAAPIRFENLDRFPHPCAMLVERSVIDEPWFSLRDGIEAANLLDDVIRDVAASMVDCHADVLPLLRSNAINLHPVAGALYHDCFYHHGAGSREFRFRVSDRYQYLDGWPKAIASAEQMIERLFRDPEGLVELLRGRSADARAL